MEAFEHLARFYENYDEDGRLLLRRGQVEYLTTLRYIEKYLRPGMRILEIGAGTGRYSHALARMGYAVTAVELVPSNLDKLIENTQPGEDIRALQGNATDLSFLGDESFDMVLSLGPMYHLFTEEDQRKALLESLRVTKKGGFLYVAYCMADASILCYGFLKGNIFRLIEDGMVETEGFKVFSKPSDIFKLYRKEDIDALMDGHSVQRLHFVGTDMYTKYVQNQIDEMDDQSFEMYVKYHFSICERADMVGITHHSLDVMRRL